MLPWYSDRYAAIQEAQLHSVGLRDVSPCRAIDGQRDEARDAVSQRDRTGDGAHAIESAPQRVPPKHPKEKSLSTKPRISPEHHQV